MGPYVDGIRRGKNAMDSSTEHTLYRFFSAADELLYVGITCNPGKRMERHRDTKAWWSEIARMALERHPNRAAVLAAERSAIEQEKPRYNIRLTGEPPAGPLPRSDEPDAEEIRFEGLWFHSVVEGEIKWQGHVLEQRGDVLIVQLYSWLDGCPFERKAVLLGEILGWRFYPTSHLMGAAYQLDKVQWPAVRQIDCPRCDAKGEVFRPEGEAADRFTVIWRRGDAQWADRGLSERDFRPDFGCGICPGRGAAS